MSKRDIIAIIFWIGLSLFFMIPSIKIGIGEIRHPGPGFMPFYVGVILLIISVCLLIKYLLCKSYQAKTEDQKKDAGSMVKIITVVASLTAYGIFLERVGFIIGTFFLVGILFKAAGVERWRFIIMGSVLTVLISYVLFTSLGLKFPKGMLGWV